MYIYLEIVAYQTIAIVLGSIGHGASFKNRLPLARRSYFVMCHDKALYTRSCKIQQSTLIGGKFLNQILKRIEVDLIMAMVLLWGCFGAVRRDNMIPPTGRNNGSSTFEDANVFFVVELEQA